MSLGEKPIMESLAERVGQRDDLPLYRKLIAGLEMLVSEGRLKRGALLPSERDLADTLGISRVTVRKALDVLIATGTIRRRQGSRTEVIARVEKSLARLSSFSEDMLSRGLTPGCDWISKELSHPTPAETMALGLGPNSVVLRLRRVRTADGTPIALETAAVPGAILSDPDQIGDSLYEALGAINMVPERAVQRMHAGPADASDIEFLGLDGPASLLVVERRCFFGDRVIEYTQTRYRGDVYDFVLELHR